MILIPDIQFEDDFPFCHEALLKSCLGLIVHFTFTSEASHLGCCSFKIIHRSISCVYYGVQGTSYFESFRYWLIHYFLLWYVTNEVHLIVFAYSGIIYYF